MPVEVILPKVDMDMSHGTLAAWHAAEGDWVVKGTPLFDIETDKAAMEVEAPATGRLQSVTARPGDQIAVGTVVGLIFAEGETQAAPPASGPGGVEVILPKVDMDMSHGIIARWHVAEGGEVTRGTALFDIETDKAAMEVEAPASGVLQHVSAREGDRVAVGTCVAWIYPKGAAVGERPAAAPAAVNPSPARVAAAQPVSEQPASKSDGLRATPAARRAARNAGVELATLQGSGPRGRIQLDDIARKIADAPAARSAPANVWTGGGGPLSTSKRGGEGAPIVLLHGITGDSLSWLPLEKSLGTNRPLIRIDLPGHGRSPRREVASFAELSRMIVEAFDEATAGEDKVHLVGHSLGGALALALADVRARRISSLSLIAPAGLGPEIDAAAIAGIARASRVESLAPWLRRLTATSDGISDDYARAAMAGRRDPELRAFQSDLVDTLFPDGVQAFDLRAALGRLECPAQMLWGRSDHILPHRHALAADGEFAIHLLKGVGHLPQIECPDRVARIVMRLIAGVEAPV